MRSPTESSRSTISRAESFQAVWKLYCKHCHVLWSSRGMEAVVMARPAIRCFSTDLPPLGCDVVYQPVTPSISDLIVDTGCSTCSSLAHHARRFDLAPSGPCDCHVQDIACLGCGNVVGYYIHRPCFRCLAQRLRIKQRGFQHLWTFYQDNVYAVQREDYHGEPVGWEDLPSPPAPTATIVRNSRPLPATPTGVPGYHTTSHVSTGRGGGEPQVEPFEPSPANTTMGGMSTERDRGSNRLSISSEEGAAERLSPSEIIESSRRDRGTASLNETARSISSNSAQQSESSAAPATLSQTLLMDSSSATSAGSSSANSQVSQSAEPTNRRAHWLTYTSQRVAAERVLLNPRSSRDARTEATRTLASLRDQQRQMASRRASVVVSNGPSIHQYTQNMRENSTDNVYNTRSRIQIVEERSVPSSDQIRPTSNNISASTPIQSIQVNERNRNTAPLRPSTQTFVISQNATIPSSIVSSRTYIRGRNSDNSSDGSTSSSESDAFSNTNRQNGSSTGSTTPGNPETTTYSTLIRRDEAMEPLCPPKPRPNVPPPSGLCNWLFQVGLDCMVRWEEITLSR